MKTKRNPIAVNCRASTVAGAVGSNAAVEFDAWSKSVSAMDSIATKMLERVSPTPPRYRREIIDTFGEMPSEIVIRAMEQFSRQIEKEENPTREWFPRR